MNLDELKEIIDRDGGRVIVVEKGEPVLVVMSFDEYKKKLEGGEARVSAAGTEAPEARPEGPIRDVPAQELTIDDLPV